MHAFFAKIVVSILFITTANVALSATPKAIAVLIPTEGSHVSGVVTFTQMSHGVKVVADMTGLSPGKHGFHIHEYGDCHAPDGTSAGGHFNPRHMQHAGSEDVDRHAGDLGNITAKMDGKAHYAYVDKVISLHGKNSIIGRSVIVHVDHDDLKTQPTGNAGARLACGVIGVAIP